MKENIKEEVKESLFYLLHYIDAEFPNYTLKRLQDILEQVQKQVSVEPVVKLKLAEYVQMNFDKYWDEMGETGAENYFETATQKELIAYGQFRAFESVQNFLEGNSKFSV